MSSIFYLILKLTAIVVCLSLVFFIFWVTFMEEDKFIRILTIIAGFLIYFIAMHTIFIPSLIIKSYLYSILFVFILFVTGWCSALLIKKYITNTDNLTRRIMILFSVLLLSIFSDIFLISSEANSIIIVPIASFLLGGCLFYVIKQETIFENNIQTGLDRLVEGGKPAKDTSNDNEAKE